MNRIVHLILYSLEETSGCFYIIVVVKDRGIKSVTFCYNLRSEPDLLQLLVREHMSLDEPFFIHETALNGIVLANLPGPFSEPTGR